MSGQSGGARQRPIGLAVVGAGYWGPNLVRNARSDQQFDLRWVCDRDLSRAARAVTPYGDIPVTQEIDELLADDRLDAVALATPAGTHAELMAKCMAAGKHVLVEKPLATSYAEAAGIVAEAERRGLTLMCDHTYCYTPAVQKMHELICAGDVGDIQYVDSVRINLGLIQPDIDVIWDLVPHDLAVLDYLLPEGFRPVAVAAHGADPIGVGRTCIAYLTIYISGGAIAHAHVNWLSPTKIRMTTVGGSKRMLVWDDLNPTQRVSLYDRGVDMYTADEMQGERRREMLVSYRSGDVVAPALTEREALATMLAEFAAAITEGRPAATDGRSGLRVLNVLEAASTSLRQRGETIPLLDGADGGLARD